MVDVATLLKAGREPSLRRSKAAQWRETDTMLTGVFTHDDLRYAQQLLAYGLHGLKDRTLRLALPAAAVKVTGHRAALLDVDVEILTLDDSAVTPEGPVSAEAALAWFGDLGKPVGTHDPDVFGAPGWLEELAEHAQDAGCERVVRSGYWSWHWRGREVLRAEPRGSPVRVRAGVNYTDPGSGEPTPVMFGYDSDDQDAPSSAQLAQLQQAVDGAIARRRSGEDAGAKEHLLQATLRRRPELLGMQQLVREYPAFRPRADGEGRRSYIDFLGIDDDHVLQVIETKIGPDPMLGLQGLDYWAWVKAHKHAIAKQRELPEPAGAVGLHYVVGTSDKTLVHPAAAATMAALSAAVPWRSHVIDGWDDTATEPFGSTLRRLGPTEDRTVLVGPSGDDR